MIRKFVKAGSWVLASNIWAKGLNFVLLNVLARFLNPTGFGLYNAIISSAASINQICDVGSTMVLQRSSARINELPQEKIGNRFLIIFLIQFIFNLVFTLAIYLYPDFFDRLLFHNSITDKPIQLIGLVALMQIIFQVPLTLIIGLGEFKKYALRMILSNGIALIVTILTLLIFGINIKFALWGLILSLFINALLSWRMLQRVLKQKEVKLKLVNLWKETIQVFREGFVYYLGNIFAGAIFNIVLIGLFSKFIGIEEFGYVRIATAMVAMMSIVPAAVQSVNITFLARNEVRGIELKSMQLRYISVACFLISMVLLCYLNFLIKTFFGAVYLAGREIFVFIILLNMMIVVSAVITSFLVSKGHGTYVGIVSSISVILNIVASLLLIPRIGIYGYYIGQTIGFGLGFILVTYKEFKEYNYPDLRSLRKLAAVLVLGLGGIIPVFIMNAGVWMEIYKVVFILCMVLLTVPLAINETERSKAMDMLKLRFHFNR
jgi:O-antigen/teichoic acid export membrane protein